MPRLRVIRFKNSAGKRRYDRAAAVDWNITADPVNRRIIIQTEETRYYTTENWIYDFIGKESDNAEVEILKRKSGVKASAGAKAAA